jgi:hypothetical protein
MMLGAITISRIAARDKCSVRPKIDRGLRELIRRMSRTSGLNHLVKVNPTVKIYAPEEAAYFNGPTPLAFIQRTPTYRRFGEIVSTRSQTQESQHDIRGI